MSLFRHFSCGVRALFLRSRANDEIDDEFAHYAAELQRSFETRGLSPDDARRAARLETGSALAARQQVRDSGWEAPLAGLFDDIRIAARRLRRSPAFTLTAVATLGLGFGATTAIFSVIDAVLLRPLPYPDPDRLVALWHTAPGAGIASLRMSPSLYFTYKDESRVFQQVALWNGNHATVTGAANPESLPTLFVTPEFLGVLGVRPAAGRDLAPDDDRAVLLSAAYAASHFGSSAAALGRRLTIDGNPHEIVGVLPGDFEFLDENVSLILPRRLRRDEVRLIQFSDDGIARLKPGVTLEQANADLARCIPLAAARFAINPGFSATAFQDARISPRLRRLKDSFLGDVGATLWTVMAAVAILLAIACANVANLVLVRVAARGRELGVRAALGAGAGRIARDILVESVLLGLAGGGAGAAFCSAALSWLPRSGITNLPRLHAVAFDFTTAVFLTAVSCLAGGIFGLIPALKHARAGATVTAAARSTETLESRRFDRALLTLQVSLAMVLLVGSGLMLRTFRSLRQVDPGFSDPGELQAVRIAIPPSELPDDASVTRRQEVILRAFASIPGVSAAAITTSLPMTGAKRDPVYVAGQPYTSGLPPARRMRWISPGLFTTLGTRLIAGRDITWDDVHRASPVALVSDNMARELWGSPAAALGQRIRAGLREEWRDIVGVVADIRDEGVGHDAPTLVYWPLARSRAVDVVLRSPRAGSAAFLHDLQQALSTVAPALPLANVRTLDSIYRRSLSRVSFALALLTIAAAMGLLLGVVGIYGAIAYTVARRRREIGIRLALGAQRHTVTRAFVGEALVVTTLGAALGTAAALVAGRAMQSLLFGVTAADPTTYAAVFLILTSAATAAAWLPARRAAATDPLETLRSD